MQIKRIIPRKGQESVWDYPRPPRLEKFNGNLKIVFGGKTIVETNQSFRILETSHPPTYYLPMESFLSGVLRFNQKTSFCEYKGEANYYDIVNEDKTAKQAAWGYANPNQKYILLRDHVAVYAHMMDDCFVNNERVIEQEGDFYGGWITSNIVGPFKGGEGTWGW